jgi:integrase
MGQHEGLEECLEARRHRKLPLARLRHTWASWHRQSGTPTHELQRLGGWRSSVMVERYAHLAPDHLATAANRLDSLLGGYDMRPEKAEGQRSS